MATHLVLANRSMQRRAFVNADGEMLLVPQGNCEPSYPDFCLAIGTADLDCADVEWRRFTVLWKVANPDPHRFDGNSDGVGCES